MPRPDQAHLQTDKLLQALEARIARVYREAKDGLDETVKAYFESFRARDEEMKKRLDAGEITAEYYLQWRLNQIGRGMRFEALRDLMAERYTQANELAISYVNDTTPGVYTLNRNYSAYTIERTAGNVGFTLFDESTVRRLIVEEPDVMPYYPPERAVNRGIDLAYGKSQITKNVTSGILQGKSVGKMAADLQTRITEMDRTSAVRAARTAVTAAQNAGRMDIYHAAEKMGIHLQKEWLATLDSRTRHSHRRLDGERRDPDDEFSNGCRYPGDPRGKPAEVYNCRCTLITHVLDIPQDDALRRDRYGLLPDMTYAQWERQKRGEGYLQT